MARNILNTGGLKLPLPNGWKKPEMVKQISSYIRMTQNYKIIIKERERERK